MHQPGSAQEAGFLFIKLTVRPKSDQKVVLRVNSFINKPDIT